LGARSQYEIVVPFGMRERPDGGWTGGTGDVALGFKRTIFHSLTGGSILSLAAEAILPTGDEDDGLGKGTAIFEPFVAFGQILPRDAFLQMQAGAELPLDTNRAQEEGFLRVALGRTFTQGRWGRSWSPLVELIGAREFAPGETTHWDVLPQVQVSLSTRQHILASAGVRFPLNETAGRAKQLWLYLLWDFFDGGLLEGW
jgi:hypothetical protein